MDELSAGSMRLVEADGHKVGVFNCAGQLHVPVRTFEARVEDGAVKLEVD